MLLTFLFGFKIAFSFGHEYFIAISFANLITDPLWDSVVAIGKIAKIDISSSNFLYKTALKNSMVVTLLLSGIGTILFFSLYKAYGVILEIGIIFLIFQIADLNFVGIFKTNLQVFMQLEYSATKSTVIHMFSKGLRMILSSILLTPFNTDIAQVTCGVLGYIVFLTLRYKNFKLDNEGNLKRKEIQLKAI